MIFMMLKNQTFSSLTQASKGCRAKGLVPTGIVRFALDASQRGQLLHAKTCAWSSMKVGTESPVAWALLSSLYTIEGNTEKARVCNQAAAALTGPVQVSLSNVRLLK